MHSSALEVTMLLRFSASNFRSIAEEQEMLLTASKLSGDGADLISSPALPKYKVLPVALMYGANAAGKSNFLEALLRMCKMVANSHRSGSADSELIYRPFKLDLEMSRLPTKFSTDFIVDESHFVYEFAFTKKEIVEEELTQISEGRASLLFRRNGELFVFGRKLKGPLNVIRTLTRPNSLFLSAAAQNNHLLLTKIYSYFSNIAFESSLTPESSQAQLRINKELKNNIPSQVIDFLSGAGTGIISYKTMQPDQTEEELSQKIKLREAIFNAMASAFGTEALPVPSMDDELEVKLGHLNRSGETVYFDLSEESAGTKRLLSSLPSIFNALDKGIPICVDEIDASLHTHIAMLIVALFSSKETNPKGAQLLATTHDTNLLRSPSLRRDQIWFAEKSDHGETRIFSLADFKIREGDNMEKAYLQGRFGAIPATSVHRLARSLLVAGQSS
jgi:AAA15 family ATPase/GTPase